MHWYFTIIVCIGLLEWTDWTATICLFLMGWTGMSLFTGHCSLGRDLTVVNINAIDYNDDVQTTDYRLYGVPTNGSWLLSGD